MTREELRDLIADAINDSMDVDWQSSWAADSILAELDRNRLVIVAVPEHATEDEADDAIAVLTRKIEAARNSNQHGEDQVVTALRALEAANAMGLRALYAQHGVAA